MDGQSLIGTATNQEAALHAARTSDRCVAPTRSAGLRGCTDPFLKAWLRYHESLSECVATTGGHASTREHEAARRARGGGADPDRGQRSRGPIRQAPPA